MTCTEFTVWVNGKPVEVVKNDKLRVKRSIFQRIKDRIKHIRMERRITVHFKAETNSQRLARETIERACKNG